MNKAQATKIHTRLITLSKALRKVDEALRELDKEDRKEFSDHTARLWVTLHARVLPLIYARYPELRPIPDDFDDISSDLQWKDVTLPNAISAAELDAVIISKLKPRSLKVAKIIGDVMMTFMERGLSISEETVSARIRWLDDIGRIESFGDLRKWRYSEIALKS